MKTLSEVLYDYFEDAEVRCERAEAAHRDLLSACKQWRQATESRLRLTGPRGEAIPLAPDAALFEAIDKAQGKA